jgi:hypothetical protein
VEWRHLAAGCPLPLAKTGTERVEGPDARRDCTASPAVVILYGI